MVRYIFNCVRNETQMHNKSTIKRFPCRHNYGADVRIMPLKPNALFFPFVLNVGYVTCISYIKQTRNAQSKYNLRNVYRYIPRKF